VVLGAAILGSTGGIAPGAAAPQATSLVDQLESYGNGQFGAVIAALTQGDGLRDTVRRLQEEGGSWVDAAPPDERARRFAILSTVALEMVSHTLAGTTLEFEQARPLIEWMCERFRRERPSRIERLFHLGSIAVLQAARDEEMLVGAKVWFPRRSTHTHVLHGAARFPSESRFKLAWLTSRPELSQIAPFPVKPGVLRTQTLTALLDPNRLEFTRELQETVRDLGRLVTDPDVGPDVGQEAILRRGVLHFTMGNEIDASADLRSVSSSSDPFIGYLAHVMLGVVHERRQEIDTAIDHFEAALRHVPATAASIALASALTRAGRDAEAARVIAAWRASEATRPQDPWRVYGSRDYRRLPAYVREMRSLIHP
jgi:hypothetical protein